ncbi:MAG: arylsulfotransferase family protein, partial [Actinomycetota bacterium]|nr:arylsulfotransferase family protein [Actinomycetota bacterium]
MVGVLAFSAPAHAKPKRAISVYPLPGTPVASDATTFSFRGIKKKNLGPVTVTGSKSGRHTGRLLAHSDGRGVSYLPKRKFVRGELVRVKTKRRIRMGKNGNFWVRIGRFYGSDEVGKPAPAQPVAGTLKSRPNFKPPVLDVRTVDPAATQGKIFFSPKNAGMTIADRQGRIVWFRPNGFSGSADTIYNFQAQRYRGKPVLTYWKGASTITGFSQVGHFEILNRKYNRIARFKPGNGYEPDMHEFVITPRNTALVLSYRGVVW